MRTLSAPNHGLVQTGLRPAGQAADVLPPTSIGVASVRRGRDASATPRPRPGGEAARRGDGPSVSLRTTAGYALRGVLVPCARGSGILETGRTPPRACAQSRVRRASIAQQWHEAAFSWTT